MNNEYCIKSGEFMRLCNTTRDTLRYYNEQGILVPRVDEENGYHYYSYAQVGSFHLIKSFRDMGTPIEEIKSYFAEGNHNNYTAFIENQYNGLIQRQKELAQRIVELENVRKILDVIHRMDLGEPIHIEPDFSIRIKQTPVQHPRAYSVADVAADIETHMNLHGMGSYVAPMGVVIKKEDFLAEDYRYSHIFSMRLEKKRPGERSSFAGVVCREADGDIRKRYAKLVEYIKDNALTIAGDFYCLSVINSIDPDGDRRYLKLVTVMLKPQ